MSNIKIESWGNAVWVDRRGGFAFKEHIHLHAEIIYVETGEVTAYLDGIPYTVTPGHIFIAFPNHRHSYSERINTTGYIAIFKSSILYQFGNELAKKVPEYPLIYMPEAKDYFLCLLDARAMQDEYTEYKMQSLMTLFVCALLPKIKMKDDEKNKNDAVSAILCYINNNYDQPITLESMSRDLHISKSGIMYFFREALNTTFLHYLNATRIDKAKQLLADGSISITQIASLSGFNTIRSFSRNFYSATGTTPTEYRKNCISPPK